MAASSFSIINGTDGVSKVPISTVVDANGFVVVGHVVMSNVAGVATAVDATHPLAVTTSSLPLPSGAATDATLTSLATLLTRLNATLTSLAASEAPYAGVVAMTPDQAQAAQRAIRINCSTAGNVSLTYADGSTDVVPVAVGLSYIAGAFTTVNSAGTTAVATYANLR